MYNRSKINSSRKEQLWELTNSYAHLPVMGKQIFS